MNKRSIVFVFIASLICFVSSCSKSPEEKIKQLASTQIKKNLYIPESYSFADIRVDSAFAPYDSPKMCEYVSQLSDINSTYDEAEYELKMANRRLEHCSGPYSPAWERQEAKDRLQEAQGKLDAVREAGAKCVDAIKKLEKQKPQFIGYEAIVSYRAKNNSGDIVMDAVFMLVDEKSENICYMCSVDNYNKMQEAFEEEVDTE